MPSWKYVWTGDRDGLSALSDVMTDVLYPPADAVSLTKADAAREDEATGWTLEAYFADQPDVDELAQTLNAAGFDTPEATEELPDIDWVAHALEGLGIVRCGRFVLYGIHDVDGLPNEPGDIPIRIDANQAFGTGHHPTTSGCLKILDTLEGIAPGNVLDLGTGSAVLAIAAAKLWDTELLATDIDAKSVEIAAENAALNEVPDISFVTAAGFDHETIAARAPYDFIFANILAGPLQELAPDMARHVRPGATVVLAGLLAKQEQAVISAYVAQGFALTRRQDHATWPVLVFQRTAI